MWPFKKKEIPIRFMSFEEHRKAEEKEQMRQLKNIPPFSGNKTCPACGGEMGTVFHPFRESYYFKDACRVHIEHLDRVCKVCGYQWIERSLADEKRIVEGE